MYIIQAMYNFWYEPEITNILYVNGFIITCIISAILYVLAITREAYNDEFDSFIEPFLFTVVWAVVTMLSFFFMPLIILVFGTWAYCAFIRSLNKK